MIALRKKLTSSLCPAVGLKCVEAIHHPSFSNGSSQVQREMQEVSLR